MLNETDYDIQGYKTLATTFEAFWQTERDAEAERDSFIVNPISVDGGLYLCRKCRSKNVISVAKQVRSSDEGTSVFCTCMQCRYKWREE